MVKSTNFSETIISGSFKNTIYSFTPICDFMAISLPQWGEGGKLVFLREKAMTEERKKGRKESRQAGDI